MNLLVNEEKLTGAWARNCDTIQQVLILKFAFGRGGSRIFFRRGCTRLLLYFNTNKPQSFFFCRIPIVLENRRSSQGRVRTPCTLPLDLPLFGLEKFPGLSRNGPLGACYSGLVNDHQFNQ